MSAHEPTVEQLDAIRTRDRDAFCEAGAGTGKTRVLVERYCESVSDDGVEVERILAFTFTERAAAELRTRARRRLSALAREARARGDSGRAEALGRAARATERAWVMTIHAFCLRVLAADPAAAGLDPSFRVLDEAEATRLRERAVADALDALLEAGDADAAHAAAAYKPWRLCRMAVNAHERLRSHGMADPRLPPVLDPPVHSPRSREEQRELSPAEIAAARSSRAALERLVEGLHTRYEALKHARSALDFADLELRAAALLRSSPTAAAAWSGRFAQVMVDEFQDTNRVQLEIVDALRGPQTRLFTVGDEHQSIYRFRNADLQVFRERRAAAARSERTAVLPLRGNFRSRPGALAAVNAVGGALLDGFAELTAGRKPAAGDGTVADAELLLTLDEGRGADARRWAVEDIALDPPPGGAPASTVAEARTLAERLRELVDSGEAQRGDIVVLLRAFTHVDTYEEALARAGLVPYVLGGRGYWTQQQVEDLVRLLGTVSNPLDDERLFGALASFAAAVSPDALWLLRRAAGGGNGGGARHVWPLVEWAYGPAEGEPRGVEPAWLDAIPAEDAERLRRFCSILGPLRAEAPLLSLEALIERTMNAFDYDLGLLSRDGGSGRMANVRKLMRLARSFEASEGRDLAGFVRLASESTRRDEREGMAAVRAEGHDGVRVMTVHAAKGLEFPVVAVPDLGRSLCAGHRWEDVVIGAAADGKAERFGMRLAFPTSESFGLWELVNLSEAERDAEAEESCRLVYVAASRARERLILSGVYRPTDAEPLEDPRAADPALRRLLPALADLGWEGGDGVVELPAPVPVDGGPPEPERHPLSVRISEPSPERAAELTRRRAAPPEPDPLAGEPQSPPLVEDLPHPVPAGHLSYSALEEYKRCGYRFYVTRVLGAREQSSAGSHSLAFGNAVHALLEWSARTSWGEPESERVCAALRGEGLDAEPDEVERASTMVGRWLGSELCAALGGDGVQLHPEASFLLPLAGTVVRGKIDLLAELPGGDLVVVDYKTDALDGQEPDRRMDRYAGQRALYALAAASGASGNGGDRPAQSVRTAYAFLGSEAPPLERRWDAAELAAARSDLEQGVTGIRRGTFVVTQNPHRELCGDCPARERLCSHPPEMTLQTRHN